MGLKFTPDVWNCLSARNMQTTGYEITFRASEGPEDVAVDLRHIWSAVEASRPFSTEKSGYDIVRALAQTCAEGFSGGAMSVDTAKLSGEIDGIVKFLKDNGGLIRPVYGFAEPGADGGKTVFTRDTRVDGKRARLFGGYDTATLSVQVWPNAFRDYDVRGKLNVNTDDGLFLVMRSNRLEHWLDGLGRLKSMLDDALKTGEAAVRAHGPRNHPE